MVFCYAVAYFIIWKCVMRQLWPIAIIVILIAAYALGYSTDLTQKAATQPQRIISLAPSITETLFAINAGSQVVAVTDYCDYPSEVTSLPSIGGHLDTHVEAIITQQPDLVVLPIQRTELAQQLHAFGIATVLIDNHSVETIIDSILILGEVTGHHEEAIALSQQIQTEIEHYQSLSASLPVTSAVVVLAHYTTGIRLDEFYISGQQDIYNQLLEIVSGKNAYEDTTISVPKISQEGLLAMNPDVIIDIFPEADDHPFSMHTVSEQWQQLSHLSAVQNNRVHLIEADYATIPGPRIFQLLPAFAQALHPEHNWQRP
jgi:iron complex transport system substrate-binding protein